MTRLDFAVGSSGLMRQALSQAIDRTTDRRALCRAARWRLETRLD